MRRTPKKNGSAPDRMVRVNELLKREIASWIESSGIIEQLALVSVTRADCATTLKNATIGFTVLDPDEEVRKKVFAELNRRKGEIQQAVSRNVILKYTPVLRFVLDRNIEEGDRVLAKIRELEEQERNENP